MTPTLTGRPGRPAACTREDALNVAISRFLACERVDVQAIAKDLGLARATMHRWFHTRDGLLGEAVGTLAVKRLLSHRSQTRGRGAKALVECFHRYNSELVSSEPLRYLLAQEQDRALRILTSSAATVQPLMVQTVKELLEAEIDAGKLVSPTDTGVLAYAIVRLSEAFLYNDAIAGIRGDIDRLREVQAALLGLHET
jgi:AcrR family transcriptional regulator